MRVEAGMRVLAIVAALWCLGVASAGAQVRAVETVTLQRGQAATLQFDEGGGALLMETSAAPEMTPFELSVSRDFVRGAFDHAIGDTVAPITTAKRPEAEEVQPHMVRLKFVQIPDTDHTLLLIENGYGQGLRYRAVMHVDGEGERTDVCLVMPNLRSLEHWPYGVDAIELSDFHLLPWRDGDPLPCE